MSYGTDKWKQGYACAVACVLNMEGEVSTPTHELYNGGLAKLTEPDMIKAGIDQSDIDTFKKYSLLP